MPVDQTYIMALIIGYTCVGVFVCTSIITLLSIVGIIHIDPAQSSRLFQVLIVEIAAISISTYAGLLKLNPVPVQDKVERTQFVEKQLLDSNNIIRSGGVTAPQTTSSTAPASAMPRVYIQISNNAQQTVAGQASAILKTANCEVPGIEFVGSKAPVDTELRYFHPADQAKAEELSKKLKDANIPAKIVIVQGFPNVRPLQFELWFPKT